MYNHVKNNLEVKLVDKREHGIIKKHSRLYTSKLKKRERAVCEGLFFVT